MVEITEKNHHKLNVKWRVRMHMVETRWNFEFYAEDFPSSKSLFWECWTNDAVSSYNLEGTSILEVSPTCWACWKYMFRGFRHRGDKARERLDQNGDKVT